MSIFETYSHLSELYHRFAIEGYEKDRPYDSWEDCQRYCERFRLKLYGMLTLMQKCGEINSERYELEAARIMDLFGISRVYQANKKIFGQTE